MGTQTAPVADLELVQGVFARIAADLGMIIDREISCEGVSVAREGRRPEGRGSVHISFRFGVHQGAQVSHGCVLVPLADAIAMASYLMMISDDQVAAYRGSDDLDRTMKDAMLEVGNFMAGACDAVIRRVAPEGVSVRPEGCQGVRADVRPAFPYAEGSELIVGRALARVHQFPPFEMILMLPASFGE